MLTNREKLRARFAQEMGLLEQAMAEMWMRRGTPKDWPLLPWETPLRKVKKKKTIYLDEDVFNWFKKLGPGFHARIADVLRVYALAVQAGELEAITRPAQMAPEGLGGLDALRGEFREMLREMAKRGQLSKEALAAEQGRPQWLDLDAARAEILGRLSEDPSADDLADMDAQMKRDLGG